MDIGPLQKVHFVWDDDTSGAWGSDVEIFYTSFPENGSPPIPGFNISLILAMLLFTMVVFHHIRTKNKMRN